MDAMDADDDVCAGDVFRLARYDQVAAELEDQTAEDCATYPTISSRQAIATLVEYLLALKIKKVRVPVAVRMQRVRA